MYQKKLKTYLQIRYLFDKFIYRIFFKKKNHEITILKEKHKGKPLLIVGNGPSLKRTPLEKFNIPSIGMNKINLYFDQTKWRPDYIICVNGFVMKQNKKFFKESAIPIFMDIKALYLNVRGKNVNYFVNDPNINFCNNYSDGLASGATVTFSALQFAYLLEADPVILVGVDHSFKLKNNTPSGIERMKDVDENHFHPNYFEKGKFWGIPDLENSELNYMQAKEKFELENRTIYDATVGGKLDIFSKISVDEAISIISDCQD